MLVSVTPKAYLVSTHVLIYVTEMNKSLYWTSESALHGQHNYSFISPAANSFLFAETVSVFRTECTYGKKQHSILTLSTSVTKERQLD